MPCLLAGWPRKAARSRARELLDARSDLRTACATGPASSPAASASASRSRARWCMRPVRGARGRADRQPRPAHRRRGRRRVPAPERATQAPRWCSSRTTRSSRIGSRRSATWSRGGWPPRTGRADRREMAGVRTLRADPAEPARHVGPRTSAQRRAAPLVGGARARARRLRRVRGAVRRRCIRTGCAGARARRPRGASEPREAADRRRSSRDRGAVVQEVLGHAATAASSPTRSRR